MLKVHSTRTFLKACYRMAHPSSSNKYTMQLQCLRQVSRLHGIMETATCHECMVGQMDALITSRSRTKKHVQLKVSEVRKTHNPRIKGLQMYLAFQQ